MSKLSSFPPPSSSFPPTSKQTLPPPSLSPASKRLPLLLAEVRQVLNSLRGDPECDELFSDLRLAEATQTESDLAPEALEDALMARVRALGIEHPSAEVLMRVKEIARQRKGELAPLYGLHDVAPASVAWAKAQRDKTVDLLTHDPE